MKKIGFTTKDLMSMLDYSRRTIYRKIEEGRFPGACKVGGKYFIPRKDVIGYLEKEMKKSCVSKEYINEMKALL